MSIIENKEIAKRAFEEYDACKGNQAGLRAWVDNYCKPGFIYHHPTGNYDVDTMILGQWTGSLGIPNYHYTIDDIIAEGDKIVIRYTLRGSHKGPYMGFAATGKHFETMGVQIFRIVEMKLVESWDFQDNLGGLMQLGLVSFISPEKKDIAIRAVEDMLQEREPCGVLVYNPLMKKLEEVENAEERREIVTGQLQEIILNAIQDIRYLNDIRAIAEKYPEFIPEMVKSDHLLRLHAQFGQWMKYASKGYKCFIQELEGRLKDIGK